MHFHGEVAVEVVDQRSPRYPFTRWVGREDESARCPGQRRNFGDGDIGWSASPPRVLVERPPGLGKPHVLNVLVGALNERLNILRRAHRAGNDGFFRACQGFGTTLSTENRRGGHRQGQGDQETWQSMLHCHDNAPGSAYGIGSPRRWFKVRELYLIEVDLGGHVRT